MLTLGVSKGKILGATLPVLERAGIRPAAEDLESRRLITEAGDLRLVVLRGPDVATYVRHGAVDAGIVGNDLLEENDPDDVCVLCDLGISKCRLVVAAAAGFDYAAALAGGARLSVATKYPRLAREHFALKGIHVTVVKLHGSMEIAPATGLATLIVDLTDTGRTLRENGLVEVESIMEVSSRLVCNMVALREDRGAFRALRDRLARAADGV